MNKLDKMLVETIINIFKVDKGELQVLLFRKQDDPYKGYWILPSSFMKIEQTLDDSAKNVLQNFLDYHEIYLEQLAVFSDVSRINDNRVVGISYLGLTDSITEKLKFHISDSLEYNWFSINNLPKMAYDHNEILLQTLDTLKYRIHNFEVLKALYPSDFTLPEVQRLFEQLWHMTIDRRNFRKKLIIQGWINETGGTTEGTTGRPGKLYYFDKTIKEQKEF